MPASSITICDCHSVNLYAIHLHFSNSFNLSIITLQTSPLSSFSIHDSHKHTSQLSHFSVTPQLFDSIYKIFSVLRTYRLTERRGKLLPPPSSPAPTRPTPPGQNLRYAQCPNPLNEIKSNPKYGQNLTVKLTGNRNRVKI